MWPKCGQITKLPQLLKAKSVENFPKTRIKMKKYTFATLLKKKCGGYNHWYIRKVADFHISTLFKNFLAEIFSKRYFSSKVWRLG
jgi:retron-type reverse transcriptase